MAIATVTVNGNGGLPPLTLTVMAVLDSRQSPICQHCTGCDGYQYETEDDHDPLRGHGDSRINAFAGHECDYIGHCTK